MVIMSGIPIPPPPPLINNHDMLSPRISKSDNKVDGENNESNPFLPDLNNYVSKTIIHIKPVAQSGPNCGLAALAMATSVTPRQLSIHQLFNEAHLRGFTRSGEMFSAANMRVLAESVLSPWFRVELFSGGLAAHKEEVIESLLSRSLMLIPYDADKNNSPCCKKGHKAHWALVCGVLVKEDSEVSVAVRQGKSRYLSVWTLASLQESNNNLTELGTDRLDDGFLLPEGGVRAGLAGQFILLKNS